jgi:iron-sulfur cluster assembly accessory protein
MDAHSHEHDLGEHNDAGATLTLTEAAAEKAKAAMQREGLPGAALRVSVVGGGCSGFQYSLGFDSTQHDDDQVLEQYGVRILIDPTSAPYLSGTTIDYVNGLHGAGFKFLNPNATRTCGCGSSFSA